MRVVALGGAGGMGRWAARTAVGFGFVEELVLADRDLAAAAAFAQELGPKARAVAVDVQDQGSLVALLRGQDAVLNTVGPSYRFGLGCLRAAIAAGTSYLDVCDDWEPTLAMLALHEEAVEAGVTALIGLGASPGVSNLLARMAAEELDEVESLVTAWDLSLATPERRGPHPSAATVHGLHQLSGQVRVWRGGQALDEGPLKSLDIDVPGRRLVRLHTIGHPEPVTLPRRYPGLQTCLNAFHAPRLHVGATRALGRLIDWGGLSVERAAGLAELLEAGVGGTGGGTGLPALFAWAEGVKNGVKMRVVVEVGTMPAGGMGAATGIPLAVGLKLLAAGQLDRPGVFAPEDVVEPAPFFGLLAAELGQPLEDLVAVRRSGG
jgi:saccharopine dehydrogenase-like NADP-dependent oxidoreductase